MKCAVVGLVGDPERPSGGAAGGADSDRGGPAAGGMFSVCVAETVESKVSFF